MGKSQDSTDEASAEPMKDDTATVAYLGGKNKDSMNGASVGLAEKGQQQSHLLPNQKLLGDVLHSLLARAMAEGPDMLAQYGPVAARLR